MTKVKPCPHLQEVIDLAIKYNLDISPDYYPDCWVCPLCKIGITMMDEIYDHKYGDVDKRGEVDMLGNINPNITCPKCHTNTMAFSSFSLLSGGSSYNEWVCVRCGSTRKEEVKNSE